MEWSQDSPSHLPESTNVAAQENSLRPWRNKRTSLNVKSSGITSAMLFLCALNISSSSLSLSANVVTNGSQPKEDTTMARHSRASTTNELEPQTAQSTEESTIRLTRFQVPSQVRAGDFRRLSCQYELHQATLHAMKLFKDNKEFFRYTPNEQKLAFPVVGVQVDMKRSNGRDIWLRINRHSSGSYKCQVLVEGTFNSVSAEKRMEVVMTQQNQTTTLNGPASQYEDSSLWPSAFARPRQITTTTTTSTRNQNVNNRHQQSEYYQPATVHSLHAFFSQSSAASAKDNHHQHLLIASSILVHFQLQYFSLRSRHF